MRGSRATVIVALALLLPAASAAGCSGCSSNETEPPEPPAPAPTPVPVATMDPDEDAGADDADAGDASDAKPKTGGGDPTGIKACCDAIRHNQKNAPPEQQVAYGAAIFACDAALSSPDARRQLATIRQALSKAGVPAQCK